MKRGRKFGLTSASIDTNDFKATAIDLDLASGTATDDAFPTAKAVKDYVDAQNTVTGMTDTTITSVGDNNHLQYDSGTSKWVNRAFIDFDKLSKLSEEERWRRRKPLFKNNYIKDCKAPFHTATVFADGSVIPCCTFQGKNLTLGNINGIPELGIPAQSLKELWDGEKMNELREQFRTGELNIVCQYCLNHNQSEIFENIEEVRK